MHLHCQRLLVVRTVAMVTSERTGKNPNPSQPPSLSLAMEAVQSQRPRLPSRKQKQYLCKIGSYDAFISISSIYPIYVAQTKFCFYIYIEAMSSASSMILECKGASASPTFNSCLFPHPYICVNAINN